MPDTSGGFVWMMQIVAKIATTYDGDHADVYSCCGCKQEIRWKYYSDKPRCFVCGCEDLKLLRRKSEY